MAKKKKKLATARRMQTRVPMRIRKPPKAMLQARVDGDLMLVVRPLMRKHHLTLCSVIEWGMREFLAHLAPDEARRLNIEVNAS